MVYLRNRTLPYPDLVASHLRSQISALQSMLETIERTNRYDEGQLDESLRGVEHKVRALRRFIEN